MGQFNDVSTIRSRPRLQFFYTSILKVSRIIFVIFYGTVFLFFSFFFPKARSASFTEMHVRLDGLFYFNSTLLKVEGEQQLTEFQRIYTYAKNKNRVSVNCAVEKIYLTQIGMMNGYYRKKTFLKADPFFPSVLL